MKTETEENGHINDVLWHQYAKFGGIIPQIGGIIPKFGVALPIVVILFTKFGGMIPKYGIMMA